MKLFISYRSSDAAKVDKIARDLTLLLNADGTSLYTTWQDKHDLPPASPNWWDAIVDAIDACDMLVFNISRASLQSEVCRAELEYAHKCNLPIIPVVLDGEYFLNRHSGKYDLSEETWKLVPDWLAERQFLFYTGAEFYGKFQEAVAVFERNWPRRLKPQRPLNPDSKSVHGSNHALYDAACDYAERLAFTDAQKHFDSLLRRNDADYAEVAAQWLELLERYAELMDIDQRPNARFLFKNKWTAYTSLFPKEFLDGLFDPKGFASPSPTPATVGTQRAASASPPSRPTSLDLMPAPFAWIDIPGKGYSIAKYPITNAQYAKFIKAGGYNERKWWTDAGWAQREQDKWTQPRFWTDAKWNAAEQPVVGVSWYESVAFCLWLSETSGEQITLPTEDQWQYAAQGDDGHDFPWGKQWDGSRCNNNVDGKGIGKTTPMRQYAGKGDSPFGVVDMAGNVWEWCLTDYAAKTNDSNSDAEYRVLRGGSWDGDNADYFRCGDRFRFNPNFRNDDFGFRISRS